jgi:hypothetical protein
MGLAFETWVESLKLPGAPSFACLIARWLGNETLPPANFVVAVASGVGPGFSLGITDVLKSLPLAEGRSEGEAETTDLSLLPLSLFLPLFSLQSTTPKLFFTLLLSKIACQAPKLTKKPITQAPSTR